MKAFTFYFKTNKKKYSGLYDGLQFKNVLMREV